MNENKNILLIANEAVSSGNYETFLDYCTDDIKWSFIGDTEITGKNAVLQYMKEIYIAPPIFDVKLLIAEDSHVIAKGTIKMLNDEDNYETYDYCDIWKFKDGKMEELQAFVIEKK